MAFSVQFAADWTSWPAPRTVLVSDLVMFKLRVVAGCDLLGISNKRTVGAAAKQLRLVVLPVKGLDLVRTVAVTHRNGAYLPAAARRLAEILKLTARKEPAVWPVAL